LRQYLSQRRLPGSLSLYHVRQVCVFLDLMVVNKPEVMLSSFDGTFDKKTQELVSEKAQAMIVQQLTALKELSLKLNPKEAVVEEL
jgi:chromate reductase